MAKKLLLLLLKAGAVYLLVFLSWYWLWSGGYLKLIGWGSSKFLPVILLKDYRVQSFQVLPVPGQPQGRQTQLRFTIQVSPKVTNWIQFGATDLSYPVITFLTLVLVTPGLSWKKRLKILLFGSILLWFFTCLLALLFFRVIDFADARGLSQLGIVEDILGIQRLARWKQSGGLAILAGQVVPVAIWFISIFGQLGKRPAGKARA